MRRLYLGHICPDTSFQFRRHSCVLLPPSSPLLFVTHWVQLVLLDGGLVDLAGLVLDLFRQQCIHECNERPRPVQKTGFHSTLSILGLLESFRPVFLTFLLKTWLGRLIQMFPLGLDTVCFCCLFAQDLWLCIFAPRSLSASSAVLTPVSYMIYMSNRKMFAEFIHLISPYLSHTAG